MSSHGAIPSANTSAPQRIEVITGHERRRHYSDADKARLVAETYEHGQSVHIVARRHGLCSSLLYRWRRSVGDRVGRGGPLGLIPVQIAAPERQEPAASPAQHVERLVEIALPNGCTVRVDQHVDARALRRILAALRG